MSNSRGSRDRYALSFTSGALLERESAIAAPLYLKLRDWQGVRDRLDTENPLQSRTASSRSRLAREVVQRLAALSLAELKLLTEASSSERCQLMWVAACRRYLLIGEFAEEVVRERFLLLTPTLGHDDFDSFVHSKALWHPELDGLKDSTLRKLRATLFRMLAEADLLADGEIVQATVSERVQDLLTFQVPSDMRFLPTRDSKEARL